MKRTIVLLLLSLAFGWGYAQVTTKKEVSVTRSENGKAHVKIVINNDGKETIIDTVVTLDRGRMPAEIDKMIKGGKPGERKIMIELDSTLRGQNFDFDNPNALKGRIEKFRKDIQSGIPPRGYNLPDENFLKDFFNEKGFQNNLRMYRMPGMTGRIHKLGDEEFARLRQQGIFTEKEDLAEQLDVRYVNLAPCGEDSFVLNFVSKERGKITVTLCDKEGKVISASDAAIVSSKEINGRNVYTCVINEGKDKKFTFIKLSKDSKLALFSNGF